MIFSFFVPLLLFINTLWCSKTYYEFLGVPRNANEATIKSSFRKLSRTVHPDKNNEPDAKEKWYFLQEAVEVLTDKKQRKRYDDHLRQSGGKHEGFKVVPDPPAQQRNDFHGGDFGSIFGRSMFFDFEDFFGGGGSFFSSGHGGGSGQRQRAQTCRTFVSNVNGVITRRTICS